MISYKNKFTKRIMNQQITKVNADAVDTLPYLATMINGLVHEPDMNKRRKIGMNAMEALQELLQIERERYTDGRSYIV